MRNRIFVLLTVLGLWIESTGCNQVKGAFVTQPEHGQIRVDLRTLTADGAFIVDSSATPFDTPIIIIRKQQGDYSALSMRCPMGLTSTTIPCRVSLPKNSVITCPCDGSHFDFDGKLLQGPAKEAMKKFAIAPQGDGTAIVTF